MSVRWQLFHNPISPSPTRHIKRDCKASGFGINNPDRIFEMRKTQKVASDNWIWVAFISVTERYLFEYYIQKTKASPGVQDRWQTQASTFSRSQRRGAP
jgi:hypothetical protein